MRFCEQCHYGLSPLARFCGRCGRKTGFDLPVLRQSAKKTRSEKTETSRKRKSLAALSLFLFILIFVFIDLLIIISFSLNHTIPGVMFASAGLIFIIFFIFRAKHIKSLIRRDLNHHCPYCGTRFLKEEKYCEQCGLEL